MRCLSIDPPLLRRARADVILLDIHSSAAESQLGNPSGPRCQQPSAAFCSPFGCQAPALISSAREATGFCSSAHGQSRFDPGPVVMVHGEEDVSQCVSLLGMRLRLPPAPRRWDTDVFPAAALDLGGEFLTSPWLQKPLPNGS